MFRLRLVLLFVAAFLVSGVAAARAGDADETDPGAVVVADVKGPVDQRIIDYLIDVIRIRDAQVIVLQIDSPDVASGDLAPLLAAMESSPIPITAWVGPSGAVALGDISSILVRASVVGAAQGAAVGLIDDTRDPEVPSGAGFDEKVSVTSAGVPALGITEATPTIGQFIVGLDGQTVETSDGAVTLETATTITTEEGIEVVVPSVDVRFLKPGLFTRFLRLASRPEGTMFFLVIGISAAVFEFYAAGVGVSAAVAALALFLAGYGMATLPMNWWAMGLVLLGMLLYTASFQRNRIGVAAAAGTASLIAGGWFFTASGPQYPPRLWLVLLIVAAVASFYVVALPTVVRARFSTRTIGRQQLVGRVGVAETSFDPEGVVDLDGSRWRARAPRAAAIEPGDVVEVVEVKGILLEVMPTSH